MIFSELYSAYYNAIAKILQELEKGRLDDAEMRKIIEKHAFSESALTIIPALRSAKWQLIGKDMTSVTKHVHSTPVTLLEKQWLKAITLDSRLRLFDVWFDGLDDVEPLFTPLDYIVYDKYCDSDPFEDEAYIQRFRLILKAIHKKKFLKIKMVNKRGNIIEMVVLPRELEYSQKDDKFRLTTDRCKYISTVNLSRIISCSIIEKAVKTEPHKKIAQYATVTLDIKDNRNALERCMLHFAHFEKKAIRTGENTYRLTVKYNILDETEMVIRVLSFGPHVEIIEPASFRSLIVKRLENQKHIGLK